MRKVAGAAFAWAMLAAGGAAMAETPQVPGHGHSWQVVAIGEMEITVEDGVTILFDEDRMAGRGGCNRYSGAVELEAVTPATGALTLGPVISTRMACMGRGDEVETAFHAALLEVNAYLVEADGTLSLTDGETALIRARPF